MTDKQALKVAVEIVGSQGELAKLVGVSKAAMSQAVRDAKRQIPAHWCPAIEKATARQVRCEQLRPDVDWNYVRMGKDRVARSGLSEDQRI